MKLLNLKNGKVIIDPEALTIPEFKVLWKRDNTKNKDRALKEISYIFHLADYDSPYSNYPEKKRIETLKKDILKDENYKIDKYITEAVNKFKALSSTPSEKSLYELKETLESMRNIVSVFRSNIESKLADAESLDEVIEVRRNGTVVTKLGVLNSDLIALLKTAVSIPKIIKELEDLEIQVREEKESMNVKIRGGKKIAMFEKND